MRFSRLITQGSTLLATLALVSCSESSPVGPGDRVERVEFTPTSAALGTGRTTTVEIRNTGNVAMGPISLNPTPVRNSGGVEQPSASMTPSPASVATLNANDSESIQVGISDTNLTDGTYTSTLVARRGNEELATFSVSFTVSSGGGGGGPVASVAITGGPASAEQGEVGTYTAEARDASGAPISGATVAWAVVPANAGLVTAEGKFVGYGTGQTRIVAISGTAADTLQVTVTPRSAPSGNFSVTGQGLVATRFTSDLWAYGNVLLSGTWSTRDGNPGNTLNVWNISSPDAPVLANTVVVNARTVNDVKFSPDGSLASLSHEGGTTNGITLLDMSNPLNPSVITQFSALLEPSTNNSVHNIWLEQNYAYIANSITNLLRVVDITNPSAPVTVASQTFGAGPSPALHDVYVRDGLAFLSNWTDGLIIVDVGNGVAGGSPTNPQEVSRIGFGAYSVHNAWYWPAAGYVFVGDEFSASTLGTGIVKVVDISDPANPQEVASFHASGDSPHNFWVDEARGILYAAWYSNGVYAIDVSGELMGRLDLQGRQIANSRYNGSSGCDFTSPATTNRTCTWAPQLHNGRVYVSDLDAGIKVLQPNF